MADWKTVNMRGEWCQRTWDSYPLNTLVRFDGGNYYKMPNGFVADIQHGNIGCANIYHDFNNAYGADETIVFETVKIVPKAKEFQGEEKDRLWTPMRRADKRGHSVKTNLKDILSYLNGKNVGETFVENKRGKTFVKFYKED
jgi:hypothetical protein